MRFNNTAPQIQQGTPVYHIELGKGQIISIEYRRNGNFLGCRFKGGEWDFIHESTLLKGTGDITLRQPKPSNNRGRVDDNLQQALENLFSGLR